MHFRLGDYKKYSKVHPIMPYEYYETALTKIQHVLYESNNIKNNFKVIYFCEDEDHAEVLITIQKLDEKFTNFDFIRGDNTLQDWEQMLYMSCCHHNIIANSSFSWWGAYFNSYIDKMVFYPSKWFGDTIKNDTRDLCPPEWIKIQI